jgi:ammonium transporter Rh
VANSILAGGVAVGSSARLAMTPGGALLLGLAAGIVSVYGYVYATAALEKSSLSIYDTCGVGNLHGLPSVLGGLLSIAFVAMDPNAEFLSSSGIEQCFRQLMGVVCTLVVSIGSGCVTGMLMKMMDKTSPSEYDDGEWWEGGYFEKQE